MREGRAWGQGVSPVATVRCPKCGAVNPNGRRRLARCRVCHEKLGKCRYCEHYDPRQLDCTHPARRPDEKIVDADAVLDCPEFSSLLARRRLPYRIGRATLRTTLIAVVLIASAFVLRHLLEPAEAPPVLLRVNARAPESCFQEDGFPVQVFVANQTEEVAENVRVFLSGGGLRTLTCQSVTPSEAFLEETPTVVGAGIGNLRPGEIGTVEFHFVANQCGEVALTALVVADNLPTPTKLSIEGEVLAW